MTSNQTNIICGGTTIGSQGGFSLVEVLVALLVLSIGLLGLAGLQVYGLAYNQQSYERTQATFLINDIIDHMRANKLAYNVYATNTKYTASSSPPPTNCQTGTGSITCTGPGDMANFDIDQWIVFLQNTLSNGGFVITQMPGSTGIYTVKVTWNEKSLHMQQIETVELQ